MTRLVAILSLAPWAACQGGKVKRLLTSVTVAAINGDKALPDKKKF
jgi:hypothetical protein